VRFIPLEPLVIDTPLAPAQARARLAAAVDPGARGGSGEVLRPLCGSVGLATFALRRASQCRSVLLPVFRGRIEPWAGGARITGMVSLEPPPVLVLAIAALIAFGVGAEALQRAPVELLSLTPLGAVVLAWILAVRSVTSEARRLRLRIEMLLAPPAGRGPPRRNGAP